jgi:hypothetical protein
MLRYSGPFLFLASIPLLCRYAGPAGPLWRRVMDDKVRRIGMEQA